MSQLRDLREPFSDTNVFVVVIEEVEKWTDNLKERVTAKVIDLIGITDNKIPERIKTWIHQHCLVHTAWTPMKDFTGKLAEPIDLASLPNRKK